MAAPSGLAARINWKNETTYGTKVTTDRTLPFRSESIQDTYGRLEADDIIAGQMTRLQAQVDDGNRAFAGSVNLYLFNRYMAELFEHVLGQADTTGAGPYTHAITPADTTGKSLTLQVGRPDLAGTVHPFTYSGVKVASLKLAGTAGEYMTVQVDVVAQDLDTGTALAAPALPADLKRYRMSDLALTIGGSPVCARSFEMTFTSPMDVDRRCAGADIIKEPLRNELLMVEGSVELEWTDLTHYNRVRNKTYAELVAEWTSGDDSLTITSDCRFDTASQPVAGRGAVYQTVGFKAVGAASDADTVTVSMVNDDDEA